jgi:hypothetical protein
MPAPSATKTASPPAAPQASLAAGGSPTQGLIAALGTVVIWAGFILVSRLGGKTGLTGWDIVALRLGTASLVLLPFSLSLPRSVWTNLRLWTLALTGGLLFLTLVYAGFKLAPAAHGGILLPGMQPFLVTALAADGRPAASPAPVGAVAHRPGCAVRGHAPAHWPARRAQHPGR